ncbi:N-acetylglucosamine-6-phosphate deacetylase [Roseibium sediminis]|uniref:N-acetylglucosamine-6-phosphate deacetylase n=1 Tax=Roseibium sediminis TaxID=1775174 RepID=UPI00123D3DB9
MTMSGRRALRADRIFDGYIIREDHAVLFSEGKVEKVVAASELSSDIAVEDLGDVLLSPGFVDLQVNGGGGIMLGDAKSVDDIAAICMAHISLGTTSLLPTLITDQPENTARVIELGKKAWEDGVAGFQGLHLEGPHLSAARKGAHDALLIRQMDAIDFDLYENAATILPSLFVTVAPETVGPSDISRLSESGVVVSLGHSGASYQLALEAAASGAKSVTHLFNAMSPLQHRDPGMVGAALNCGSLHVGLIADGIHVDPAAIELALRAKKGPARIYLVTDAMCVAGSELSSFELGGRTILRMNGRLTLEDGTLAGADIDFAGSLKVLVDNVGVELAEALRMATRYPAEVIGRATEFGTFDSDCRADFVALGKDLSINAVWVGGNRAA